MKRLSDYQGDKAIELWGELLDPLSDILTDKEVSLASRAGKPPIEIAKIILKKHSTAAEQMLLTIDPTPLDGLNIILRLVNLLAELGQNDEVKAFFGYAAQERVENVSSGSATENTEEAEN